MLNVTHWTREGQRFKKRTMMLSLICAVYYTASLDAVGGTTELVSHHIFVCPCTGQKVAEQKSTLKTGCNEGIWHIKCSHGACKKLGAENTRSLGQAQTVTKGRLWTPSVWRPLHMTTTQSVISADTTTQTPLETG